MRTPAMIFSDWLPTDGFAGPDGRKTASRDAGTTHQRKGQRNRLGVTICTLHSKGIDDILVDECRIAMSERVAAKLVVCFIDCHDRIRELFLANVKGEPHDRLARTVLLGARSVTDGRVGSSALLGRFSNLW